MPAKISFSRPVAVIAWATVGWLNALTDERSMIGTPGNASTSFGGRLVLLAALLAVPPIC